MARARVRFVLCSGLLASLALAGCAARQKSLFVLLPEEGDAGGKASVTVTNEHGSQVLSRPWQGAEVAGTDAPPRPATPQLDQAGVERLFGEALSAMPAPPVRFILYFESDSTDLTPESRGRIPEILAAVAKRRPAAVGVVGHTDTTGATERNVGLSLRRAEAVAALLGSLGIAPDSLDTESHGEADLLVQTADGVAEPRNRRVEVTVR